MALPASGPISLDQMHIEAGGTTLVQSSTNDADIRALIGKADGVSMNFAEWYGASGGLASASVSPTTLSKASILTTATTSSATCTPVGGTGHTYLWQKVSGSSLTVNSATSATTTFTGTGSGNFVGVYRCRVIAGGVTVYSNNITITFELGAV